MAAIAISAFCVGWLASEVSPAFHTAPSSSAHRRAASTRLSLTSLLAREAL
jgi:hypothetical protein